MNGRGRGAALRLVRRHPGLTLIALPCAVLATMGALGWLPGELPQGDRAQSSPAGGAPVVENRPAPSFDLPQLVGARRLSLESLRGDTVVLNFWASWCTVCHHEVAGLQQLSRHYAGAGVDVVGVDDGDSRSPARQFAERTGMSYPSVVDDSGKLLGKYGAAGIPTTYVIDGDGRIRFQVSGAVDPAALRRCVDRLRAGKA
ncbi:MAG TPA: TlpA disulfide reductase family protein [Dehalococcoidia bacterium]|nr:TlpA disulfide reductase family protein [Dehalococcoidia bacterium]